MNELKGKNYAIEESLVYIHIRYILSPERHWDKVKNFIMNSSSSSSCRPTRDVWPGRARHAGRDSSMGDYATAAWGGRNGTSRLAWQQHQVERHVTPCVTAASTGGIMHGLERRNVTPCVTAAWRGIMHGFGTARYAPRDSSMKGIMHMLGLARQAGVRVRVEGDIFKWVDCS